MSLHRALVAQAWAGFVQACVRILPVVFLAFLALLSYWLVRHAPQPQATSETRQAQGKPDYVMHHFLLLKFDEQGQVSTSLRGEQMRHLPDLDVYEVDAPVHQQWDSQGRVTQSQARKAMSNADGSEIQLLSEVLVHRFTGESETSGSDLHVAGEFLHLKAATEQLSSHLPVTVERGQDRFQAQSMAYDHLSQQLVLQGGVKAQFEPPQRAAPLAPTPSRLSVQPGSRVQPVKP